jgi:hypothetical protein
MAPRASNQKTAYRRLALELHCSDRRKRTKMTLESGAAFLDTFFVW